jgi:hypothetical protein
MGNAGYRPPLAIPMPWGKGNPRRCDAKPIARISPTHAGRGSVTVSRVSMFVPADLFFQLVSGAAAGHVLKGLDESALRTREGSIGNFPQE